MSFIKKIIESIGFFKNNKKNSELSKSIQNYKKIYFDFKKNSVSLKEFLNSMNLVLRKLNDALEIPLGCPKKKNEAITNQIKELKLMPKTLKKIIVNMSETKNFLYESKLIKEYQAINKDCKFIEKIHDFIGDIKNEESLLCKLLYAKQQKSMKRKNYILNNQINRIKNKLKTLNEFLKKSEKFYLKKDLLF